MLQPTEHREWHVKLRIVGSLTILRELSDLWGVDRLTFQWPGLDTAVGLSKMWRISIFETPASCHDIG